MNTEIRKEVVIDGLSLSIQDVVNVARKRFHVRLDEDAVVRVGRRVLHAAASRKPSSIHYPLDRR